MAKYKRYERYKDSGVEWIGDIPDDWKVVDFRRCTSLSQGLQIPQEQRFHEGGKNRYLYLTIKYINSEKNDIDKEFIENPNKNVICEKDDVLLARTGATGVVITDVEGVYHNNFFKIKYDRNKLKKKYLVYYLSQSGIQGHFKLVAGTTTIPDLNHGEFLSTKVIIPTIDIQNNIVSFLDQKTSEIDALIADKEKLITLLEEKRRAIITEAVTKGLNPDVKMKDSGVEWIGEIPEHWNISSVRNLIRKDFIEVQDGNHGELHPTSNDYVDEGIPFVMASDIRNGKIDLKSCKYISKDTKEKLRIGFSIRNDVLLTHKGTIGEVGINDIDTECVVLTPQVTYYRIKVNEVISNYFLCYYFQSDCIQNQLKYISSMQSTRQYIGIVAQRELIITLPNIEEQITIVDYLKNKVGLLEEVIKLEKLQIEKFKEYRQSLISEAVTGKIDVRDYCKEA